MTSTKILKICLVLGLLATIIYGDNSDNSDSDDKDDRDAGKDDYDESKDDHDAGKRGDGDGDEGTSEKKPPIVNLEEIAEQLTIQLNQMARLNVTIDDDFLPLRHDDPKYGQHGVLFKGIRISDRKVVAMKFTPIIYKDYSDREYEMYSYLKAIDNETVEQYGICNIYYYDNWKSELNFEFKLMILTYLRGNLGAPVRAGYFDSNFDKNGLNSLILFRDFVKTSKYIHNHGIRHDDIKPNNIMTHMGRTYLVDFNLSCRLKETLNGGSPRYGSRRYHEMECRTRMDDWESFLYTICHINRVKLKWLSDKVFRLKKYKKILDEINRLKQNTSDTFVQIEKAIKNCEPLKLVFITFAEEVYSDKTIPDYDQLDIFINRAIRELAPPPQPVLFTWLETDMSLKAAAIKDLMKSPIRKGRDIPSRSFGGVIFYPTVNFDYFHNRKRITGSWASLSGMISAKLMNLMSACDRNNY